VLLSLGKANASARLLDLLPDLDGIPDEDTRGWIRNIASAALEDALKTARADFVKGAARLREVL
jgi:hypothetical protein